MISKNLNNGILPNHDESLGNLQMWIISWTQVVPSYWGTKGVTAALLLSLQLSLPPSPYSFPYKPKQPWRLFYFYFFFSRLHHPDTQEEEGCLGRWRGFLGILGACSCCVFAQHAAPSYQCGGRRKAPRRSVGYQVTCTRIWDAPKENILSMDLKWSVT